MSIEKGAEVIMSDGYPTRPIMDTPEAKAIQNGARRGTFSIKDAGFDPSFEDPIFDGGTFPGFER